MFQELVSLQELYIGGNKITSIEAQTFLNLRNLRMLSIDLNKITSIEEQTFADQNNLERLNLHHNQLTTLSYDMFTGSPSLNHLNIESNNIITLNASVLKDFDHPLQLWLHGNSLECDNKLCWLEIEVEKGSILFRANYGIIHQPRCVGGKTWDKVEWDCPGESKFLNYLAYMHWCKAKLDFVKSVDFPLRTKRQSKPAVKCTTK